ncbi:hypothetical protein [Roseburia sp. 1XD42-34]|uniref:hypothetical protein n=1 Tax=Roseburia sp. 1XD42-34 TaxID=2305905 RepID=UPI001600F06A
MRELQKTGETGYRQRDSVEHKGYVEVHSAFHGEKNNQNGVSNLFERNLSPLLSNVYLNELDQLLEKRGHRFVRYADDCAPRKCA